MTATVPAALMATVKAASQAHAVASARYWDCVNRKAPAAERHAAEKAMVAAKAARTAAMHAVSDAMAAA
jgi:ferredoxin-NADP reductase